MGNLQLQRKLMEEPNNNQQELDESAQVTQLLQRVSTKETVALSELYDRYAGMLMAIIQSILNDKAEAEDILQDSFLTIWNKADMYQAHLGKPTSWMITIAKNKAYDRYRKLVRKRDGLKVLQDNMVTPTTVDPDKGTNEHLLQGFKELNSEQRNVIELVFYQGFTQQEAAKKLDAPLGTIKARIRRGLLKLKQFIQRGAH